MQNANRKRYLLLSAATFFATIASGVLALAQTTTPMPDWQKTAGGKQEFEVASVREDKVGGSAYSNFSLDAGNEYFVPSKSDILDPTGTLFSARNQPLLRYIVFAYKLNGTQELALRFDFYAGLGLHVPLWVRQTQYDIEARAPGEATKDQMRLMMQDLLSDRFKLAVHWEAREAPVFGLVLETPGKLGPQLLQHPAGNNCEATAFPDDAGRAPAKEQHAATNLSTLPIPCGVIAHLTASASGGHRFGGRNVPLALLADSLPTQTGMATLPRPVVDQTGLAGKFDFWLDWTPEDTSEVNNGETGGTFREALKKQLGLKLVPERAPVEVLVIDHVEQPSPN
ncbi:MAG TPA: TIGR03435 family protein [Terracidiphilus sp.]|jgi:uncharacterized protein (TIGR03435 family)